MIILFNQIILFLEFQLFLNCESYKKSNDLSDINIDFTRVKQFKVLGIKKGHTTRFIHISILLYNSGFVKIKIICLLLQKRVKYI